MSSPGALSPVSSVKGIQLSLLRYHRELGTDIKDQLLYHTYAMQRTKDDYYRVLARKEYVREKSHVGARVALDLNSDPDADFDSESTESDMSAGTDPSQRAARDRRNRRLSLGRSNSPPARPLEPKAAANEQLRHHYLNLAGRRRAGQNALSPEHFSSTTSSVRRQSPERLLNHPRLSAATRRALEAALARQSSRSHSAGHSHAQSRSARSRGCSPSPSDALSGLSDAAHGLASSLLARPKLLKKLLRSDGEHTLKSSSSGGSSSDDDGSGSGSKGVHMDVHGRHLPSGRSMTCTGYSGVASGIRGGVRPARAVSWSPPPGWSHVPEGGPGRTHGSVGAVDGGDVSSGGVRRASRQRRYAHELSCMSSLPLRERPTFNFIKTWQKLRAMEQLQQDVSTFLVHTPAELAEVHAAQRAASASNSRRASATTPMATQSPGSAQATYTAQAAGAAYGKSFDSGLGAMGSPQLAHAASASVHQGDMHAAAHPYLSVLHSADIGGGHGMASGRQQHYAGRPGNASRNTHGHAHGPKRVIQIPMQYVPGVTPQAGGSGQQYMQQLSVTPHQQQAAAGQYLTPGHMPYAHAQYGMHTPAVATVDGPTNPQLEVGSSSMGGFAQGGEQQQQARPPPSHTHHQHQAAAVAAAARLHAQRPSLTGSAAGIHAWPAAGSSLPHQHTPQQPSSMQTSIYTGLHSEPSLSAFHPQPPQQQQQQGDLITDWMHGQGSGGYVEGGAGAGGGGSGGGAGGDALSEGAQAHTGFGDLQHVAASLAADVHALLAAVGGHRAQLQAATHTSKHAQ